MPQSAEEAEQLTLMVQQLQRELLEERGRVDALKHCLEQVIRAYRGFYLPYLILNLFFFQERDKSEFLAVTSKSGPPTEDPLFQHEWIVFNQRRFEALEMQRTQLAKDLHRQRALGARVAEELQRARDQLRRLRTTQGAGPQKEIVAEQAER